MLLHCVERSRLAQQLLLGCYRFCGGSQWGRLSCEYLHSPDLDDGVGNTDDSVATPANPARICPPPCMREEISLQGPPAASSFHLDGALSRSSHLISLSLAPPTLLVLPTAHFPVALNIKIGAEENGH